MNNRRTRPALAALGLAAAIAIAAIPISTSALAAAAPAAAPASHGIDETIVTARRQAENIQEVPLSITAFAEEDIERVAPRTLRDFDGLAPNVRIGMNTAGPSAAAIFIRGIGYADIEKTQSPAVSTIIDGVQQGSNTGQLVDTFDVSQIEILRGPQGVLQGKNTTGGAIIINRIAPVFNEYQWAASAQVGSYDERQIKGRVNIPLIDDTLALKISAVTKDRDGFLTTSPSVATSARWTTTPPAWCCVGRRRTSSTAN
jgi:iron complex outermembrane recepter protein